MDHKVRDVRGFVTPCKGLSTFHHSMQHVSKDTMIGCLFFSFFFSFFFHAEGCSRSPLKALSIGPSYFSLLSPSQMI